MNSIEDKLESQLIHLIKEKKSFSFYRLPSQEEFRFIAQLEGQPEEYSSLSDLNNKKGFLVSPFKVEEEYPIILIRPEVEVSGLDNIREALDRISSVETYPYGYIPLPAEEERDEAEENRIYTTIFSRFIAPLKKGELKKIVLSRAHKIKHPNNFSILNSFFKAAELYPHMMCYLCYTPQAGLWMGSTPEIILSGKEKKWKTVSLAGTKPLGSYTDLASGWDRKNIEEQEVVSRYIRSTLATHVSEVEEKGPYSGSAGTVIHLKTDFYFTLNDSGKIGNLLDDLFPTPAICGFPKQAAFDFINENESYNRRYYSGIIGNLNPEGETELFVNLRCAEIGRSTITLYAGGGIMPTSSSDLEWEETKYKMQTLLKVLQ